MTFRGEISTWRITLNLATAYAQRVEGDENAPPRARPPTYGTPVGR